MERNSRKKITAPKRRGWCFVLLAALLLADGPARAAVPLPRPDNLQAALELHLQIAAAGGWPAVPPGPTLAPGDSDPRVPILARRLAASGDLRTPVRESSEYDGELEAAVRRFQARHGLEPDGLVGRATLRALNVPVAARIRQLELNLERIRANPAMPLTGDSVFVNIPAFSLYLLRDGRVDWTTRVIVGETETETPLFSTKIESVVLNPTWAVPYSIASREMLPKIRHDPGYLARGGYAVFDRDGDAVDPAQVDWAALDGNNFPFTFVQRPGPANELGRVKFIIPNEHGVCMHDTPKRQLFVRAARAFSHGCIRMEKPLDFAARLLEAEGWTVAGIDAELATAKTRSIALGEPLPVIVAYVTAAADEAGTAYFFGDIYDKDGG